MVFGFIKNYFGSQYRLTKGQNEKKQVARAAAEGGKPFGKPWGHTYGSAYFSLPQQLVDAGLAIELEDLGSRYGDNRFPAPHLGGVRDPNSDFDAMAMADNAGHILTLAPTRSGKGATAVIPNLLTYDGSILVNDIKGENFAVTARRRRQMGQEVFRLAPFEDDTDHWNPFDEIGDGDDAWEDARLIADMLMMERKSNDQFWDAEAKSILTGFILNVAMSTEGEDRTIAEVRRILTLDWARLEPYLEFIEEYGGPQEQRAATQLREQDEKLRKSLMATLDSHLSIWDSSRLARMMSRSDFKLSELKAQRQTIYIIIPPERVAEYAPVLRLFFGMAVNAMTRSKDKPKLPILFLIDEFPQLGHMGPIEKGLSYLAGYGVNLWLFAQDLNQLASSYGQGSQSIIANCGTKQFFGVSDFDTASLISKMCGGTEVPTIKVRESGKLFVPDVEEVSSQERPLLSADEIMALPEDVQLLFLRGQRPVAGYKMPYFRDDYAAMYSDHHSRRPHFDPNPFHEKAGDRLNIAPFEHEADGEMLIAGVTDRAGTFYLAKPSTAGESFDMPSDTAFVAYRGMLAVAPCIDGELTDKFTVHNGNADFTITAASNDVREIIWTSGEFEGAHYHIVNAISGSPKIANVESYGASQADGESATDEQLLEAAAAATDLATAAIEHRIFRVIPPGYYVRYDIDAMNDRFANDLSATVAAGTRNAICAMRIMSLYDLEDPDEFIEDALKPIGGLEPTENTAPS